MASLIGRKIFPLTKKALQFTQHQAAAVGSTKQIVRLFTPAKTGESQLVQLAIYAAANGDMKELKSLVEDGKVAVASTDYDLRSPLHLAAAEGQKETLMYLLERKAIINAKDRWGTTPLDDAIRHRHREIVQILRQHGAGCAEQDITQKLCDAASKGDKEAIQIYLDAGANINAGDYDKRTPLHLAAAEGHISAVDFLIKQGANVNVVDRFGNTPVDDAERGTGRNFRSISQMLREIGGESGEGVRLFSGVDLRTSIHDGLPMLCERWGWHYAETWLPSRDGEEFVPAEWHADKAHFEGLRPLLEDMRPNLFAAMGGILATCFKTRQPIFIKDIDEKTLGSRALSAQNSGVRCGAVVPILEDSRVAAVLQFFSREPILMTSQELENMTKFSGRIVRAGLYQTSKPAEFDPVPGVPEGQMAEVFNFVVKEGVFNASLVYHEVDWFYNMGLQSFYFQRFANHILANHIHSYIAAKKFATTTGSPEDIWLHIENNEKLLGPGGPQQALFMIPHEHHKLLAVERLILRRITEIPESRPYSLEFFLSENANVPRGNKKLCIYVLQTNNYANPSKLGSKERNIWEVASESFLAEKSRFVRERYQDILNVALDSLAPVARVYEPYRDGSIPVMFAFHRKSGATADYLMHLTELTKQVGLHAHRKFIETFANGLIVFSLYLNPAPETQVEKLVSAFGMLHLTPVSPLTHFFLRGQLSAEEYTYASAASRFIYYFINQRSEEFESLAAVFKNDPLNMGRLRNLATSLKREAVSLARIHECLLRNRDKISKLFADFHLRVTTNTRLNPIPKDVIEKLKKECERDVSSTLDSQILQTFLMFNAQVLKTNLYKGKKAALAFRFDPSFIRASPHDWPVVPYGVFFVMAADFQGFHVRFMDIARGGIRILKSRDASAYEKNLSTLFAENYGLAYTQNKKNKDIPEFGSKGVILPRLENNEPFMAFQKYCSGVLDLLIPHEAIVDNYGKPELLFLGPDEGTGGYMEWACEYARRKGYPFWRSFTTGKPPEMGGIPHDMFGMTTRSVRRYVLQTLTKAGLKEENITKVQTGGPDGDLGSNEILLSNDKTKAVIDGSGVIFDPNGINRTELTRLAKLRKGIELFDTKYLSPGGFKVLVGDTDIKLPHGEIVQNGAKFRDSFHLHPLCQADLFLPCGGRPESINLSNVKQLIDSRGKPRWKFVIEGANLFLTQDARMILEDHGVILYKDASTNKGGVTSSSLEVLSALAMTDQEYQKHMCVTTKNKPKFYEEYVAEIQKRIEQDADLECDCIWRENARTGKYRYILTDLVSDKINDLNVFIHDSTLYSNKTLRTNIMARAIPKTLQGLVGLENILKRVPEPYLKSIFSAYIASRYVYKFGIDANEFAFFEFVQPYLKNQPIDL